MPPDQREKSPFVARVWRVRLWIRIACLAQALGWLALFGILGVTGEEGPLTWAALAVFVLVVPFLAFGPRIRLDADGALRLRGWTRSRTTGVDQIVRLSMNEYGLVFWFADGSHFTSIIFQATHHLARPRVLEFVEALTGEAAPVFDPWDVLKDGGLELYSAAPDTSSGA